jgi:hypothetical protein
MESAIKAIKTKSLTGRPHDPPPPLTLTPSTYYSHTKLIPSLHEAHSRSCVRLGRLPEHGHGRSCS